MSIKSEDSVLRGYGPPPFFPFDPISDELMEKLMPELFKIFSDDSIHLISTPGKGGSFYGMAPGPTVTEYYKESNKQRETAVNEPDYSPLDILEQIEN